MVNNKYILCYGTILNGKYIIGDVIQIADSYIEYNAVDLVIKEEVIIRELFVPTICVRNTEQSDMVSVVDYNTFMQWMEYFKSTAAAMARAGEGLFAKNFFYENRTGYVVLGETKKAEKGKSYTKYIVILSAVFVCLLLLCSFVFFLIIKNNTLDSADGNRGTEEAGNMNPEDAGTGIKEETTEAGAEETAEEAAEEVDLDKLESDLKAKLADEIPGEVIKTFFGDFNDDGKYEMWATVWDNDGIPYDYIVGNIDSNDLSINCDTNNYNLDIGREYRQLQIWYVDEDEANKIDDYISIILTEEYVNGTSTYWGEDTFYYPIYLNTRMVRFGKRQQLALSIEHAWMTARGGATEVDKTLAVYGNENGPAAYLKESGASVDYELRDDSICASEYEEYYLSDTQSQLYYPVYYLNGAFVEQSSVEIDLEEVQNWKGFKETYDEAMAQELNFGLYVYGAAANVSYSLKVDNVEFTQYLYNDAGYIFLNGTAGGIMSEFVSALGDQEPYYSEIDVCLEMKLENGEITEYRWLGSHQKKSATDFEKIESDISNAIVSASEDEPVQTEEEPQEEAYGTETEGEQEKVALTVYSAGNVKVFAGYAWRVPGRV